MREGMNLCPIIVAGMIPCFPFLSVGGQVVLYCELCRLPLRGAWALAVEGNFVLNNKRTHPVILQMQRT